MTLPAGMTPLAEAICTKILVYNKPLLYLFVFVLTTQWIIVNLCLGLQGLVDDAFAFFQLESSASLNIGTFSFELEGQLARKADQKLRGFQVDGYLDDMPLCHMQIGYNKSY